MARSGAARGATRARAEAARRQPRERSLRDPRTLAEFIRNLQEGIYITTPEGRILDANPAFLEMFGVRSLGELGTATAGELVADPSRRREELAALARDGAVREFELDIRRPDGEVRTVLDTCYQVADPRSGETLFHGILVDITERKNIERQLERAALRDPLTGCFNRRFLADMERALDRTRQSWGAIVADVDHFKEYNDRYGHHVGDRVLVRVARFLMALVRAEDAVVRIGGDEFLLLVSGEAAHRTGEVAQRLLDNSPGAVPVALSVGWAVRTRGEHLDDTVRRADYQLIRGRLDERRRPQRRPDEPAQRRDDRPAEAPAGARVSRRRPGGPARGTARASGAPRSRR